MEALPHLDRAVGGEDAQRLARTLVHAHVQRHPIHVQRADGVVDDETDVVRMPASRPMFMTWIGNGVLDGFLEDESLFGEFLRTPVSKGGVEPLVVEPPHIVVEVGA